MFCEPLHKARERLTRALRAFQDRLAEHVEAALGVSLTRREFALEVREPSAPPVNVSYAFDAAFAAVGSLIPLALSRKLIERVLLRKARWEGEKPVAARGGLAGRASAPVPPGVATPGRGICAQRAGHAGTNTGANEVR